MTSSSDSSIPPSLTGRTLGRYEVLEEISRGGMGVVYRGRDIRLNRDVALKVLPQDLVADAGRRARFVQEAQAASALEHPHIAVIHEIDEIDGVSFIAMELLRGDKLSDLTARGSLPPGRALDLAIEIGEGLSRAHDKGILHRDLKPANVMLTDDGHAKIIDFGLAKLVDALNGESDGVTILKHQTDPGVVLGTASYMSPEQATGGKVDHRSDIFSFGILLYELLSGRPPFRGKTGVDTMHAILHDPPPPLPALGGAAPAEASSDIARIIDKCLAKDPAERYQGMRDVVVDLRAARRRLESTAQRPVSPVAASTTREGLMNAQQWVYAGVAALVLALAAVGAIKSRFARSDASTAAPAAAGQKPSVAVLYFENNTGNPQLDWLRTGLTDMLVTDLSQSPDVEVLPTDRLVQILGDMKRQDDRVISFDTVQEIAKRAGVKQVVLGSYVKSGDTIRINLKLQDASSGRLLSSERVEAAGESNLFPTVDDLTRRIKAKFTLGSADPSRGLIRPPTTITTTTGTSIDRDLKEVTTTSIDAYRYYAEGINLHERAREAQAVPLLEKAIQVDPSFALALIKLAVAHNNLGHSNLRDEYAARAFEHVDRVTTRERYYIEGYYYSNKGDTLAKAIDAYNKVIELYPDHASSRNNLAVLYGGLERYDDAIPHLEELRKRHMPFPGTYSSLAHAYAATGRFETGRRVLEDFLRENPDSVNATTRYGMLLADGGKFDDAQAAIVKAEQLDPGNIAVMSARHDLDLATERWSDSVATTATLLKSTDSFGRFLGAVSAFEDAGIKGRTAEAIRVLERGAGNEGAAGSNTTAGLRNTEASLLLALDRPALALAQADRAVAEAHGRDQDIPALILKARATARLGRADEARAVAETIAAKVNALPSAPLKRFVHLVAGEMALDRGDAAAAVKELTTAETLLPRMPLWPADDPHVEVWYNAGLAHIAAKSDAEAAARFQRVIDSGLGRTGYPIEYVRSLYFLGQIAERRGDRARASDFYRRFVAYWGDGDVDRDRVADAKKKLSTP